MGLLGRVKRRLSASPPTKVLNESGELDYVKYWETRYQQGGTSGAGSYGDIADYKAAVINRLVQEGDVKTVVEFGCGDGNQLSLYNFPDYLGLDVAPSAVEKCREMYRDDPTKRFQTVAPQSTPDIGSFDMTMSIEVLMHVIDEADYLWSLDMLFQHSNNYVVIHAPLRELVTFAPGAHEKYREIFMYLIPYLGDFAIVDVLVQPGVTPADRRAGQIGPMSSDFIILQRRSAIPSRVDGSTRTE